VRRRRRRPSRAWVEGLEVLGPELESCLVRWQGFGGREPSLRTRDDWAEMWERWGAIVLPKVLATLPGIRPAAMYACGLVPRRPLRLVPPPDEPLVAVHVGERDGSEGVWHFEIGEPWQVGEAEWLLRQGVIDRDEYQRHRQWCGEPWQLLYPFEVAEYV